MEGRIKDFLLYCKRMDFGKVELSKLESAFYNRFNSQILSLCRSLPQSVQTDSMLFLMRYSGLNLGDEFDFFGHYYPPAWSILYWLSRDYVRYARPSKKSDITNAVTAHSMAMFLHSLDDHLTDGQVFVSTQTLLLRSQAWAIMNRAFIELAEGLPGGKRKFQSFLDEYYSSIQDSNGQKDLDSYCHLFRRQMAIGMVAPILLSMKINGNSEFIRSLEIAYGSFGIAWRLIDDIRDLSCDMEKGVHSAIYLCLPKKVKTHWNNRNRKSRYAADDSLMNVLTYILEKGLIEKIKERVCTELEAAASIVEAYSLKGLAHEFRCLAGPLRRSSGT